MQPVQLVAGNRGFAELRAARALLNGAAMKPKQIAVALFVLAGLVLVATFTKAWFTHASGGIGFTGMKECFDAHCESKFWLDIPRAPAGLTGIAILGIITGIAAAGLLVHTAAMLLQDRPRDVKLGNTNAALWAFGAVGLCLLLRIFVEHHDGLHVGWGAFVGFAGALGALIAIKWFVAPAAIQAVDAHYAQQPVSSYATGHQLLRGYPLSMQHGMNRMHGHLFVAPNRLYFVCVKQGGAWLAAAGQALGGAVGGALAGLAQPGVGDAPAYDEATLAGYVRQMPGSEVMEPANIQEIKQTIWWRLIRANGKKFGLPAGMSRELRAALGPWGRQNGVRTTGFA